MLRCPSLARRTWGLLEGRFGEPFPTVILLCFPYSPVTVPQLIPPLRKDRGRTEESRLAGCYGISVRAGFRLSICTLRRGLGPRNFKAETLSPSSIK